MAVEMVDAGAAIVTPPMPGANDQIALQYALTERAAAAGADAIEGVDFAVEIAEGIWVTVHEHFGGGAGGKCGKREDSDERH
jgi:hypothetical protein